MNDVGAPIEPQIAAPARRNLSLGHPSMLLCWCLTRLTMLLLIVVPAERNMSAVDVRHYLDVATALLHGHEISQWEYPVLSLVPAVAPVLLGFSDPSSYMVGFACLSVVLDFFTFTVITRMGHSAMSRTGAWLWVAGPPLLGLVSITRLDMASCCAAAAGARLMAEERRPRLAGAFLAVGAATKVWPVVVLLVGLGTRRAAQLLVGATAAVAATLALGLISGVGRVLTHFATYQFERGLQIESVPALPLLWAEYLGIASYRTEFEFGSQQVAGPGVAALGWVATGVFCVGAVWILRLGRPRPIDRVAAEHVLVLTAPLILLLVLTNKVLSPQYLLWPLVFVALLAGVTRRVGPAVAVPLVGALAVSHWVFPYLYSELLQFELLPLVVITVRDALLVAVMIGLIRLLRPGGLT